MPDRIFLPLIIACAFFMENLDSTVLATALPAIAADFGANPIHLKLALTSYLLAIAIFLPASGWLADRFGARHIFRLALIVFTIGSIGCGLSSSIGEIVAARIAQGLGGAMMVPVGRLIVLRSVAKHELVGALAWLTIPGLIGPIFGPPVGGFLTTYFDWRWIFWINVPVGVLGVVLATLYIPDVRGGERVNFDAPGFIASAFGLAFFMAASTTLGLGILPAPVVIVLFVAGVALIVGYVRLSRRRAHPIIDLGLLAIPTFRTAVIGATLVRLGVGATPFLLPLMLQLGFGMTPFESGMVTFTAAVGALAMKFSARPILRKFGFRAVLVWNSLLAGAFVAAPALFSSATPVIVMGLILMIGGFTRSLQFTSVNALTFADIPQEKMSQATTFSAVAQQLSLSVGISVGALALETAGEFGAEMAGPIPVADFVPAFIVIGVLTASSAIPFWRLAADAGDEVSGRGRKP